MRTLAVVIQLSIVHMLAVIGILTVFNGANALTIACIAAMVVVSIAQAAELFLMRRE